MPLIENANNEGIEVEVNPIGQMSVDVASTTVTSPIVADVEGVVSVPQYVKDHINSRLNPHEVTAEQTGAVSQRLSTTTTRLSTTTKAIRNSAFTYVDYNSTSYRMSLQDIKELGTKIVNTTSKATVDTNELSIGDYIYSED